MFKWLFKKKGCAKHMNNKLEVIGIDHGWSMMKTISQVFVTGVKEITTTPALFGDVLEYEGKFYKVGTVRQEVKDTKVEDDSFYLLTLAAVAKELKRRGLAEAKVFLAVGLPLTRFGAEKNDFIKYLTKNKRVSFKYENEPYYIEIDDVAVFPQCYAAVVDKIPTMAKKTLIVDIGSWTIDIMPVINKSPDESKCVTIPKGLITCMRSINEQCVRQLNGEVDESEMQNIMRYGRSDIDDEYFAIIKAEIEDFVDKVYNSKEKRICEIYVHWHDARRYAKNVLDRGPRYSGSPCSDHVADYGCVCVVDDNGKLPESNGIFSNGSHCSYPAFYRGTFWLCRTGILPWWQENLEM
jgi:plasmid segregation protein ParM